MNEYLTESELAKELQMSRQTLLALRKDGLPYRKVRGVIRYVPEEVDAWLAVHCQGKRISNIKPMEL
jgi:predicted DNA-binding transcriptional regulator AlpA